MALIDSVKILLIRLWETESGWQYIFSQHGFNFSLSELKTMDVLTLTSHLLHENLHINRRIQGFEDFSLAGKRMIEPGSPANSLLYHALASPNVYYKDENINAPLQIFPTLFELDMLENFIYSLNKMNIAQLIQKEGIANVAIAMFSYEYRQAINTTHRKYADLCFSRTGVARVGSHHYQYEANLRAFTIFFDSSQPGLRVLPARYGAFIAVRRNINSAELSVLPYRGRDKDDTDIIKKRDFWVPIHKLFSSSECLLDQPNLSLSFTIHHENIKLKKVCEYINQTINRDLDSTPYTITEQLVEMVLFSDDNKHRSASVWISPIPHPLVEEALRDTGERITIRVPPNAENEYFAALTLSDNDGARPAPEYVNVRKKLEKNGQVIDLNNEANVAKLVAEGNYDAVMHVDHTCDGWILAVSPTIPLISLPAYSIVTAPDFIPFAEQRELIEWSESKEKSKKYWVLEPWALCDSRLLPNVTLKNSPFSIDPTDKTIHTLTAIVGPLQVKPAAKLDYKPKMITRRSSFLPDAAAGEFQPGWDITWDRTLNNPHLSAYGLGSPFLEDAKLCAALSTFWPAAAPDIARSYAMEGWPSICPLTDEEIGLTNDISWDGIPGPKRINRNNQDWVELPDFNHVDYVTQGLLGKFNISIIGQINIDEYQNRVDALWHIYKILNALTSKAKWRVLSFRKIKKMDSLLIKDIGEANAEKMQEDIFSVIIYYRGKKIPSEDNKKIFESISRENQFYIDNSKQREIWRKKNTDAWLKVKMTDTIST